MIEIWTDGCCIKRPIPSAKGVGGWAYVAVEDGRVVAKASGAEPKTTNNRMEMAAVIKALAKYPDSNVMVVSDSKYVVEGATNWMPRWKEHGWTRGENGKRVPVANRKLWQEIDRLMQGREVSFRWVRGHSGTSFNEMADFLAGEAAEGLSVDVF